MERMSRVSWTHISGRFGRCLRGFQTRYFGVTRRLTESLRLSVRARPLGTHFGSFAPCSTAFCIATTLLASRVLPS